jgi:transcriptional regulator with XRE-family HTH domain
VLLLCRSTVGSGIVGFSNEETNMTDTTIEPRLLTPEEVGRVVKALRSQHQWSQEQLAELSGLTVRIVQRLEAGQPSSVDMRRAVARAFQVEDLDWLSRPMLVPTEEQLAAQKEEFERNNLVLDAKVVDGRGLIAVLLDGCDSLGATSLSDLPAGVREAFAAVVDFVRDCMDVASEAFRTEMLGYGDTVDELAEPLRAAGYCLAAATRKTSIVGRNWENKTPLPVTIVYLAVAPSAAPPSKIAVSKRVEMGW